MTHIGQFCLYTFAFHINTHDMENRITSTSELENRVSAIIEGYRQKAYICIEEVMWKAFEEVGKCINLCSKPSFDDMDEEESIQKSKEYLHIMSKRGICGLSYTTLHDICRITESGGNFPEKSKAKKCTYLIEFLKTRTLSFEATRNKYPNYLKSWTHEDDEKLERMWCEGASTKKLALTFGRNPGAIKARIEKLELEEKYG